MSQYWFAYNVSTGAIPTGYAILSASTTNPWPGLGSEFATVSYDAATASADVVMAQAHPERYLIQGTPPVPVCQPYAVATYSAGTLSVSLPAAPQTLPTEATLTVGATTLNIALTNGAGSVPLAVHPALAGYSLPAQVSATGCVAWTGDLGTPGRAAPVATQVYTPNGGQPTIAPTGPGSQAFCRQGRTGLTDPVAAVVVQDLMVLVSAMAHVLTESLIPQATAQAWASVTVDASALTDLQVNVQPHLPVTLDNILSLPQYTELKVRVPLYLQAANDYAADQAIPGLE